MKLRLRRRFGFTLAEVAVSAAIVALLAAVTAPSFSAFMDKQRAQTTADKLAVIATGIAAFGSGVKSAAGATNTTYPGFVSELTSQIPVASAVWHNSCNGAPATGKFTANAVANWGANGPFLTVYVPQGGLVTPLGTIADSMTRNPASATAGTLAIRMINLDTADANLLDQIIDGGDGGAAGTLRIINVGTAPNVAGQAEINYLVPVAARC